MMLKAKRGAEYPMTEGSRGSVTVEAAIIVPFIFMVLIAVIISFMIMYQKVLLTRTASMAAQQAAETWWDSEDILNGADPYEDKKLSLRDLYSDIFSSAQDNFNYSGQIELKSENHTSQSVGDARVLQIREFIKSGMQTALIKPEVTDVDIQFSDSVIQRKLIVELKQQIRIPMVKAISVFTGSGSLELKAIGTATIGQPAEYVRNVDLVLEYVNRLGPKFNIDDIWGSLRDKILK